MIKTIKSIVGFSLFGILSVTGQTVVDHDPDSKICYKGTPKRWNDDHMGNITVDTEFVQFDPANPDAPSSFTGSFGISYTGPAPSQSLAGSDLSFLFSPAVTTVSLSGISVPDTIAVGDDIWNLCHTCYDFRVTSLSGGKLEGFTVIDSETREEIKSEDGVFRGITGPVEFQHEGGIEASSHFIVSIDNIEACYCVPEPSTASLSLLALACLVSRRKR